MPATEARNRITLRFLDEDVEADYRHKLRPRARQQFRASVQSSLVLWLVIAAVAYPLLESGRALIAIIAAMEAVLLVLMALERRTTTLAGIHRLGAVSNTSAGVAAVAIMWIESAIPVLGALGTLGVASFGFTVLNLPFVTSIAAVTPYVVATIVLLAVSPTATLVPLQITLLLIALGASAMAAYMRETAQRRDFHLTRVIADQERELEEEKAKQLGQYTLQRKLGQGGMGVVYRARHAMLRRPCAVKLLSTDDASPDELARFEREVQLTSELSHPNIVAVYDYGRSPEGEFYYAMEYLPGIDLETLVAEEGPLPPERAVPILVQVCEALEEAHHRGLIHRDIKPGNIILTRTGTRLDVAKVLDFGLVKDVETSSDLTAENAIAGTPTYLAPESLTDPERVGPAADLYALGAVAFFLLTGDVVFEGRTIAEVCAHHIHTPPRPPSLVATYELPPALDRAILRCLEKNPADRFDSVRGFRQALEALELAPCEGVERWWEAFETDRARKPERAPSGAQALTVDLRGR